MASVYTILTFHDPGIQYERRVIVDMRQHFTDTLMPHITRDQSTMRLYTR
jgi:hypothetical protein